MQKVFSEIQELLHGGDAVKETVSSKSVYWQIDHTLRVIFGVSGLLRKSEPADYKRNFNFIRFVVLTTGKIPRGRGKAPKQVMNPGEITREELKVLFEKAKGAFNQTKDLEPNSNFDHKYFGMLNYKQSMRFLEVHSNHHLKICRDILKS